MSWWKEVEKEFGDKVKRAAEVDVAEGGRLKLPEPGEEVLVQFTRDPQKVESEKLKEIGIEESWFARVRVVRKRGADYELSEAEYDLPLGRSLLFSLAKEAVKHGFEGESLVGKTFLITANIVERDGQKQKMYRAAYKPIKTEAEVEYTEDIEL